MKGKTCVITGATSGIGLETGLGGGWKGEAAISRLRAEVPAVAVEMHYADLSRPDEIRRLADVLLDTAARIDVLVNNAGAVFAKCNTTPDGLELTFALNHMGYFRLTSVLRDRLIASAPARGVNVASEAHRGSDLNFDDLQCSRHYRGWRAYQRLKLGQYFVHPRTRATPRGHRGHGELPAPRLRCERLRGNNRGIWRLGIAIAKLVAAIPVERGAETPVFSHPLPTSTGSAASTSATVASGSPMRRLKTTKRRRGFGRGASGSQAFDPR